MASAMPTLPTPSDDRVAPPPPLPPRAPSHALLVSSVAVRQAGTRTATVAGRIGARVAGGDPVAALVATFLRADTAAAAGALGGSFHPEVARDAVPAIVAERVNGAFTLAF